MQINPPQPITTAGDKLDDLDHDLSSVEAWLLILPATHKRTYSSRVYNLAPLQQKWVIPGTVVHPNSSCYRIVPRNFPGGVSVRVRYTWTILSKLGQGLCSPQKEAVMGLAREVRYFSGIWRRDVEASERVIVGRINLQPRARKDRLFD